ncbi:helix-turn-helix domain-containing protein [Haliscomenobacter sp.]|uniref:helix-turn-helix domain-containing protein n=1 Tax=Haliscomenobacter sp. TaxID=2717303 RepID=UPI0035945B76
MLTLLNVLSTGSAIFLSFLVLTVRREVNIIANRWLALFLLLLSSALFDGNLKIYGFAEEPFWLILLLNFNFLVLAPTLYLCVLRFVTPNRNFRIKDLWHFSPSMLLMILNFLVWLSTPEVAQAEPSTTAVELEVADVIVIALIVLQIVGYLFFSFRVLLRHQRNIENFTATPEEFQLKWLFYFLCGVGLMVLTWLLEVFFLPIEQTESKYSFVYFIAIYALGYFSLQQKEVFPFSPEQAEEAEKILEEQDESLSSRRQRIPEDKFDQLKALLLESMEKDKPYLNPEISLAGLAKHQDLSLHELSELINLGFGENFAQFINRYRVEESKNLLISKKHSHLTMVGIAFEAGFNSKTAFNTAFKKNVGISPTEFQKQERSNPVFEPNIRSILR